MNKDNQGFTIIEVLIVLVIAAVIMLIVFLAVPALQRNSRNNQRHSDAAKILSYALEYASNHNYQANLAWVNEIPAGVNDSLSIYQLNADSWTAPQTPPDNAEEIRIFYGQKCVEQDQLEPANRTFSVMYSVETASGTSPYCRNS